jgi:hypothetical protein
VYKQTDASQSQYSKHQAIYTIQQSTMAWNQIAGVFYPKPTL